MNERVPRTRDVETSAAASRTGAYAGGDRGASSGRNTHYRGRGGRAETTYEGAPQSHHSESNDMQHDPLRPDLTSDLRSDIALYLFRLNLVSFDPP